MDISIGNIIRNMRLSAKLTQEELGKKLGLAYNTISSYERGNSQPDFNTILKIAHVCNYDLKIFDRKTKKLLDIAELSLKNKKDNT